jgi:hypothetical protein
MTGPSAFDPGGRPWLRHTDLSNRSPASGDLRQVGAQEAAVVTPCAEIRRGSNE